MIAKQLFEEAASKISETLANSPAKDLEKNAKAMLGSAFNKMDLVTREEYDIQQQILIKTRVKLTELEARLAQLEAQLAPQVSPAETSEAQAAEPNPEKTTPKRKTKYPQYTHQGSLKPAFQAASIFAHLPIEAA